MPPAPFNPASFLPICIDPLHSHAGFWDAFRALRDAIGSDIRVRGTGGAQCGMKHTVGYAECRMTWDEITFLAAGFGLTDFDDEDQLAALEEQVDPRDIEIAFMAAKVADLEHKLEVMLALPERLSRLGAPLSPAQANLGRPPD